MLKKHIPIAFISVSIDSLNGDRIVKGMDKAVLDRHALTVYNINAIGIVPPLSKHVDRIDLHVKAMKEIDAPNGRIGKPYTLYANIFAIVELQVSVCIRFITRLAKALLTAIVKHSVTVYMNILGILGKNTAVNKCILINIDALIGAKYLKDYLYRLPYSNPFYPI